MDFPWYKPSSELGIAPFEETPRCVSSKTLRTKHRRLSSILRQTTRHKCPKNQRANMITTCQVAYIQHFFKRTSKVGKMWLGIEFYFWDGLATSIKSGHGLCICTRLVFPSIHEQTPLNRDQCSVQLEYPTGIYYNSASKNWLFFLFKLIWPSTFRCFSWVLGGWSEASQPPNPARPRCWAVPFSPFGPRPLLRRPRRTRHRGTKGGLGSSMGHGNWGSMLI